MPASRASSYHRRRAWRCSVRSALSLATSSSYSRAAKCCDQRLTHLHRQRAKDADAHGGALPLPLTLIGRQRAARKVVVASSCSNTCAQLT
eukprot:6192747-Pleurochrysis_carterae.AAC.3